MPLELLEYYTGHSALFPACNQPGNWAQNNATNSWGIRILFYFGMQPDQQGTNYPYASCTNRNTQNMVMPIPWALPYKHNFGAANDGTYEYWFKEWLKLLAIQDTRTMQLDLPITELKKFSFSDMIVINNVWFLIQSFKEVLPYQGRIEARMKRIY